MEDTSDISRLVDRSSGETEKSQYGKHVLFFKHASLRGESPPRSRLTLCATPLDLTLLAELACFIYFISVKMYLKMNAEMQGNMFFFGKYS
jgi:hypothetical protein